MAQLKSAGVRLIRIGLYAADLDSGVDFIKRAHAQHIGVLLTVHLQYAPNAPIRPYQPKEFPGMWHGPPLSYADPELSRQFFQQLLDKLDAGGIVLAGLELENEINHPGFNPEFPLPGEGKNFGLDDFYHDQEGQQIAKGFLQYLKIMAVLKKVRDNSQVNKHTPLISAGLSPTGPVGPWKKKVDAANPNATIEFLRANGLDNLVNAYGMHIYPSKDSPGDKASAVHRWRNLQDDLAECPSKKRYWVTEWGFRNDSDSCPPEETKNVLLVREMMGNFRKLAQEGRLAGIMYYTWTGDPPNNVFRCGELTEPGKLALQPL